MGTLAVVDEGKTAISIDIIRCLSIVWVFEDYQLTFFPNECVACHFTEKKKRGTIMYTLLRFSIMAKKVIENDHFIKSLGYNRELIMDS